MSNYDAMIARHVAAAMAALATGSTLKAITFQYGLEVADEVAQRVIEQGYLAGAAATGVAGLLFQKAHSWVTGRKPAVDIPKNVTEDSYHVNGFLPMAMKGLLGGEKMNQLLAEVSRGTKEAFSYGFTPHNTTAGIPQSTIDADEEGDPEETSPQPMSSAPQAPSGVAEAGVINDINKSEDFQDPGNRRPLKREGAGGWPTPAGADGASTGFAPPPGRYSSEGAKMNRMQRWSTLTPAEAAAEVPAARAQAPAKKKPLYSSDTSGAFGHGMKLRNRKSYGASTKSYKKAKKAEEGL